MKRFDRGLFRLLAVGVIALTGCQKVPIVDINAFFTLADATWFEEEQTLFVFYRVVAEQGIGPESQIEVSFRTDELEQPFVALKDLPWVHESVPVECGARALCGSASFAVRQVPRDVKLQLRYHRDGALVLDSSAVPKGPDPEPNLFAAFGGGTEVPPSQAPPAFSDAGEPVPRGVNFHVVGQGAAHLSRSLLVYGVFNETNTRVQWRARHQFPALRNEEVQALGLRRWFSVSDRSAGDWEGAPAGNPYGYGITALCPAGFATLPPQTATTSERAVFEEADVPLSTSAFEVVCGRATVTDAVGRFTVAAMAQKNPQVKAAFPALHSPIRTARPLGYLLKPCQRTISTDHLNMQVQRLMLGGEPEICIDDFRRPTFVDELARAFRTRIDQERAQGEDLLLKIAVHHDDTTGALAAAIEKALESALLPERTKSTPRAVGAFVFDTVGHSIASAELRGVVLWCPALIQGADLQQIPAASERNCPLLPDNPDLELGPFSFSGIPILPTREQYLTFIGKYSRDQAGRVDKLTFLTPERATVSENVVLQNGIAVATFFNQEQISAAPTDAFSFCPDAEATTAVFTIPNAPAQVPPLPISLLPQAHAAFPQSTYGLGLAWDFPFLTRMDYTITLAGAVNAFSLTVPFGVSSQTTSYYGTALWSRSEFPLRDALLQCTRFCDAPTFDSAGVYQVNALFRSAYQQQCYRPVYPVPGAEGGGYPRDP